MKLYTMPGTCALAAHIVIERARLESVIEAIDLSAFKATSTEVRYRALFARKLSG